MKKEIRVVDEVRGIVQVTTTDERWYTRSVTDEVTGLPVYSFVPSVTWICSFYPKGIQFMKWMAGLGFNEAEAAKHAAGDKGSKIHLACAALIAGDEIRLESEFFNRSAGHPEPLTVPEYEAVMWFAEWYGRGEYEVLASEYAVWGDGYAGTVDLRVRRKSDRAIGIIDIKSGQNLWPEYDMQLSAYKHADLAPEGTIDWIAVLQVGYQKNKKQRFKFTDLEDKYDLFLAAKRIWQNETEGVRPLQRDYPLSIKLADRAPVTFDGSLIETTEALH